MLAKNRSRRAAIGAGAVLALMIALIGLFSRTDGLEERQQADLTGKVSTRESSSGELATRRPLPREQYTSTSLGSAQKQPEPEEAPSSMEGLEWKSTQPPTSLSVPIPEEYSDQIRDAVSNMVLKHHDSISEALANDIGAAIAGKLDEHLATDSYDEDLVLSSVLAQEFLFQNTAQIDNQARLDYFVDRALHEAKRWAHIYNALTSKVENLEAIMEVAARQRVDLSEAFQDAARKAGLTQIPFGQAHDYQQEYLAQSRDYFTLFGKFPISDESHETNLARIQKIVSASQEEASKELAARQLARGTDEYRTTHEFLLGAALQNDMAVLARDYHSAVPPDLIESNFIEEFKERDRQLFEVLRQIDRLEVSQKKEATRRAFAVENARLQQEQIEIEMKALTASE